MVQRKKIISKFTLYNMAQFQPFINSESWSQATENNQSILDMERYNGRINILEEVDPKVQFKMAEKIAVKNKSTEYREALAGIHEDSLLSQAYFSEQNVQILQNGLRAGVYERSDKKFLIPPQNVDNLKIIMRSIFLQHAEYSDESIPQQIERLNSYVLDYAVNSVYNEAVGYMNYCRDQSSLAMPMDRPTQAREYTTLEFKQWF